MSIFIDNKYSKLYFRIIAAAQERFPNDDTYIEQHHIIPKSLGGNNSRDNLVNLTAKEHFICHRLLPKMTIGDHKRKMMYAQNMMLAKTPKQNRYIVTGRVYEIIKEQFNDINHFNDVKWQETNTQKLKGKPRSAEAIANIKASWTPERRKQASESQKGKKNPRTPEWTEKIRLANLGKKLGPYSDERRKQMSDIRKGKLAPWHGTYIKCEYCHDNFDKGNYTKNHGEHCPAKFGKLTNKQKIQKRQKQKKRVSIAGVIYNSLTEASDALNIKLCTASYRVRSKSSQFKDYFYL